SSRRSVPDRRSSARCCRRITTKPSVAPRLVEKLDPSAESRDFTLPSWRALAVLRWPPSLQIDAKGNSTEDKAVNTAFDLGKTTRTRAGGRPASTQNLGLPER